MNTATAGPHTLTFRYAAAAGTAVRSVRVGDGPATSVTFPGTSSWSQWTTVTTTVDLAVGSNAVVVAVGPGSGNYLNLDAVTVSR